MAGWRPTTYEDAFLDKAREYLEKSKDELEIIMSQQILNEKDMNWIISNEVKTTNVSKQKVRLPSIELLAKYIWVSRSNIYKWKDEHPEFSDILEEILEEQAERLINMWLSWDYNWTITKLLLAKHWYIEKQEIDNNTTLEWEIKVTKDIKEMTPEEVAAYVKEHLTLQYK